jgi:hypothetical protein
MADTSIRPPDLAHRWLVRGGGGQVAAHQRHQASQVLRGHAKSRPTPRRCLHEVLGCQGVPANQTVIFLTDGGEDVRDLPRDVYPLSEHYLGWLSVTMWLTVLVNMAQSLPRLPEVPDFAPGSAPP